MELRPTDKRVVHHANLIVDRSRMLRRRDGQDGRPGFAGMDVETEVSGEFDPRLPFPLLETGLAANRGADGDGVEAGSRLRPSR